MTAFWAKRATLLLKLADWAGDDIDTVVDLRLDNGRQTLGSFTIDVQRDVVISGVPFGVIRIDARPLGFRPRTIEIAVGAPAPEYELRFEIDSAMVLGISAPEFDALDPRLRGFLLESELELEGRRCTGADLYARFSAGSKAALLNTFTKAVATPLPIGGSVWDQFQWLRGVDVHTVLAECRPMLFDIRHRLELPAAIGASYSAPGEGIDIGFRTLEPAGSLNVQMYRGAGSGGLAAATVLGGSGRPESPYEVRNILVRQQNLTPHYRPLVRHQAFVERPDRVQKIALAADTGGNAPAEDTGSLGILPGGSKFSKPSRQTRSGLFANQGIIDARGTNWRMEDPLRPGQPHFYWFEIANAKTGANSEAWDQPESLAGGATVQIQVTCDLVPGKYAARNVPYHPEVGLDYQTFVLNPLPGEHALLVQVVHEGRPVYSRKWMLTVREFSAEEDVAAPIVAPRQELDDVPAATGSCAYRLIADATYATRLSLEVPLQRPFRGADPPEPGNLIQLAAAARGKLNRFSRAVTPNDDLTVDWAAAWGFLREMAIWGNESAESIFGTRQAQHQFYRALDDLPVGSCLHIDSNPGSFPWEWLYIRDVPPVDAPALGSDNLKAILEGFLGFRFSCDALPASDVDRIGIAEILSNGSRTRILSAVNATADTVAAPENLKFVKNVASWPAIDARVCESKDEAVLALRTSTTAHEPLHLLYVYCHHTPGAQLSDLGYNNFGDSTLYMKGKNADPISRQYMQHTSGVTPFSKSCAPLVMLNACGTGLGNDYYPSGFMPYFTNKLLAPAVVGTMAEVPTIAGYQFAQQFIPAWLATHSVHRAIADIRHEWLLGKGNPYAMFYTVYGNGQVRLQQQAPKPTS